MWSLDENQNMFVGYKILEVARGLGSWFVVASQDLELAQTSPSTLTQVFDIYSNNLGAIKKIKIPSLSSSLRFLVLQSNSYVNILLYLPFMINSVINYYIYFTVHSFSFFFCQTSNVFDMCVVKIYLSCVHIWHNTHRYFIIFSLL